MKVIDEEKFQKNAEIIRNQWIEDLEGTLVDINKLIRKSFYKGVWGFLFNRAIAVIYKMFFSKEIKENVITQFDVLLEAGREFDDNPEEILQQYFEKFLFHDAGYARCKKMHPKIAELESRMERSFIQLVKNTNDLLGAKEGENYYELIVNAYKTREVAQRELMALVNTAEEDVEFTIGNNMLKIPRLVRKSIFKIVRYEIELGKRYAQEKVEEIFGN